MTPLYWAIVGVLIAINFVFVSAIDAWTRTRPVKPIYVIPADPGQIRREKLNGLVTTPIHGLLLMAFLLSGALHPAAEKPQSILATFVGIFVWTEIWHYVSHVAMHAPSLHFIHREHHRSRVPNAWTSISFSFFEKLIFSLGIIGGAAAVSAVLPVSVIGIAAYYILYFYTNTLGHANFEFRAPGYYESKFGAIFNSPSFHAMHHARYTGNYGLLTPLLDKLFGTAWEDFSEVQTRAARGKPLTSLRERAIARDSRSQVGAGSV